MVLVKSVMGRAALAAALGLGFSACQPKADDSAMQAQAAGLAQAKAADDRVAMLEKQVSDLKAGKQVATGDQATINQISADHMRALDRQLAEAKGRAMERRKDAQGGPSNSGQQMGRVALVEVPSGARITVKINAELATDKDQPGDPWNGSTIEDVRVGNTVAWPAGTPVSGVVAQSSAAGRLKGGQGGLGISLTTVGRNGVDAGTYLVVGDNRGKRDAKFIGGTAALGALVGILTDKNHQGDHALGGAAAGAAAGTALAAGTADTVIRIPAGSPVTFSLTTPEQVAVR